MSIMRTFKLVPVQCTMDELEVGDFFLMECKEGEPNTMPFCLIRACSKAEPIDGEPGKFVINGEVFVPDPSENYV